MKRFIAVILMEGMIYSITLNAYMKNGTTSAYTDSTVAYCIKDGQNTQGTDTYFVLYYNEGATKNGASSDWSATPKRYTEEELTTLKEQGKIADVVWEAPSAFKFTMNAIHYVVIGVFMAGVAGFFVYKFVALTKEYQKIESQFKKDGTIEF